MSEKYNQKIFLIEKIRIEYMKRTKGFRNYVWVYILISFRAHLVTCGFHIDADKYIVIAVESSIWVYILISFRVHLVTCGFHIDVDKDIDIAVESSI